ncbi:MAG: SynChlorMet cassette protein ScmD [Desulfomonilaceae bacterium]|nr:SynChlorMet cassette protein ScmD [Desulfomonilaceae bacterium]
MGSVETKGAVSMRGKSKPTANPDLILREEFDDWAILFDPDTGDGYGLNPVGVFVWKRLDGRHSEKDILEELIRAFDDVPEDAEAHLSEFVKDLAGRGYVGYEVE